MRRWRLVLRSPDTSPTSEGQPVQGVNVWASSTAMPGGGPGRRRRTPTVCTWWLAWRPGTIGCSFRRHSGRSLVGEYHPDTTELFVGGASEGVGGCDGGGDRCVVVRGCFDHRARHRRPGSTAAGCQRVGQFDRECWRWLHGSALTDVRRGVCDHRFGSRGLPGAVLGDRSGSNLVSEYHPDTTDSIRSAVPVKVSAANVTGIDASLAAGASIIGHVTDDQGNAVQGVNVSASQYDSRMPGGGYG